MVKTLPSKHNVIIPLENGDYFIINPLYGNADVLSHAEYNCLLSGKGSFIEELSSKKYLIDNIDEEKKDANNAYLEHLEDIESEETQIFFVPSYACNFNCGYCYQSEYTNNSNALTKEKIDAFFSYVDNNFDKNIYITLFGGEPLLPGKAHKELMNYFIDQSVERNIDICVVTNGYTLTDYLPLLKKARIREIQVTLDGVKDIHNKRRPHKNNINTFDTIVDGINQTLALEITVNLRIVVDKENIDNLVELTQFAKEQGWINNSFFKTQLGRNYELHYCQNTPDKLFTRLELNKYLVKLIQKHPEVLDFYKPSLSISRFLLENGELPAPNFDACPGCKNEWAFDYTGNIYSCTATVGKPGESLGTYYPEVKLNKDEIEAWQDRDILSIPECKSCDVKLLCGGGCALLAKNAHGSINAPDCRPVKDLLALGTELYLKPILMETNR